MALDESFESSEYRPRKRNMCDIQLPGVFGALNNECPQIHICGIPALLSGSGRCILIKGHNLLKLKGNSTTLQLFPLKYIYALLCVSKCLAIKKDSF